MVAIYTAFQLHFGFDRVCAASQKDGTSDNLASSQSISPLLLCRQAQTLGLISGSGGNFYHLFDKQFIVRFPCCTIPTIYMLSNKIIKISTTNRNQTHCLCVLPVTSTWSEKGAFRRIGHMQCLEYRAPRLTGAIEGGGGGGEELLVPGVTSAVFLSFNAQTRYMIKDM